MALHSPADLPVRAFARRSRRRKDQQGFALLLVFLMAGVFAITLYLEMPRVAMESERAKEALLIDRGEQYKRAIQLYVNKAKRYPGDIKDLENFQNMRFLRHRYIDPMTGKDEWRMIHIQNGILTDSKLSAPQKPSEEKKDNGTFSGVENTFALASGGASQQGGAAMAQRRRASDGSMAGMGPEIPVAQPGQMPGQTPGGAPGQGGNQQLLPGQQNPTNPNQPGQPTQIQPIPGVAIAGQPTGFPGQPTGFPGQPQPGGVPGQPVGFQGQPGVYQGQPGAFQGQPGVYPGQAGAFPGQPVSVIGGRPFPGQQPGGAQPNPANNGGGNSFGNGGNSFGGSTLPSGMPVQPGQVVYQGQPLPGQPGAPVNSQFGVSPYSTAPGANGNPPGGIGQPGGAVGGPQNQAASDMINRILTSPRPGGMPTGAQTGGAGLGNGIAGVASNAEGEGIMIYNDHTLYAEWEFVFDPQKQKPIPNPNSNGVVGTPAGQIGNTPGGFPGTPVQQQPGGGRGSTQGPGNQGGFGTSNSFGTPSTFGPATPTTPQPTTRPGK